MTTEQPVQESSTTGTPAAARPWQILCGLMVSGFLLGMPGGLLPLWGYHIDARFGVAANYFLVVGGGLAGGAWLARRKAALFPLEKLLAAGCFAAGFALLLLSIAAPPAMLWYQLVSLAVAGAAAGIINTAVLEGMAAGYEANPAATALLGGVAFGGGSVFAALVISGSFGEEGATRLFLLTALLPGAAGMAFSRLRIPRSSVPEVSMEQTVRDLRSGLAVLFALLLFFQFANEWSLAGWLPIFLIDRMGWSPETGVMVPAIYWLSLMAGRMAVARLLPAVGHGRMLGVSAACALTGCTAMTLARGPFGMIMGLLLTGAGFSSIYPLAAERIAGRFHYYHPGYFNGIFTFALMGGILAPFVLGHWAAASGLQIVPLAVMAGSCAVFALVLLIWFGRRISGE